MGIDVGTAALAAVDTPDDTRINTTVYHDAACNVEERRTSALAELKFAGEGETRDLNMFLVVICSL